MGPVASYCGALELPPSEGWVCPKCDLRVLKAAAK